MELRLLIALTFGLDGSIFKIKYGQSIAARRNPRGGNILITFDGCFTDNKGEGVSVQSSGDRELDSSLRNIELVKTMRFETEEPEGRQCSNDLMEVYVTKIHRFSLMSFRILTDFRFELTPMSF
jgi:hypothetical protein